MNRAELKTKAKESLKGKYKDFIIMMLMYFGINFLCGFVLGFVCGILNIQPNVSELLSSILSII